MDSNSDSNILPTISASREIVTLTIPSTNMMVNALRTTLQQNFRIVSVDYVMCPDLRMFGFTAPGLGGNPMILEVGNRNNLFPTPQLNKKYAFKDIIWQLHRQNYNNFIIGAGKHSYPPLYDIAEFYADVNFLPLSSTINGASKIFNNSCAMWWNKEKNVTEYMEEIDPVCSMHGNFFISNGYSGLVYRIEASERIGSRDYLTCIHDALICIRPTQLIGLGGIFMGFSDMTYHVTPSCSTLSLNTTEHVQKWLKYYAFDNCPLIASGIIFNSSKIEHGGHLFHSLQLYDVTNLHFHAFWNRNTGGHIYPSNNYPSNQNIHYLGFFSVAESLEFLDFRHFLATHERPAPNFIYPPMHNICRLFT